MWLVLPEFEWTRPVGHFPKQNEFSLQPNNRWHRTCLEYESDMGFLVTTLIFVVIGIIASLCTRICCNRGPSANLLHLTLVITATVCCWMMWAIVYLAQMKPLIVPILSEGE
ncbi:hypothetical protein SLE2022_398150 [Rubroshorea leprosula]